MSSLGFPPTPPPSRRTVGSMLRGYCCWCVSLLLCCFCFFLGGGSHADWCTCDGVVFKTGPTHPFSRPILEAYKALAPAVANDKAASGSGQRSLTSKVGAAVSGGKGNKSILKLQRLMKRIGGQG